MRVFVLSYFESSVSCDDALQASLNYIIHRDGNACGFKRLIINCNHYRKKKTIFLL
jgi:hypothetical protein